MVCGSRKSSRALRSATTMAERPSGVKYMLYGSSTAIGAPGLAGPRIDRRQAVAGVVGDVEGRAGPMTARRAGEGRRRRSGRPRGRCADRSRRPCRSRCWGRRSGRARPGRPGSCRRARRARRRCAAEWARVAAPDSRPMAGAGAPRPRRQARDRRHASHRRAAADEHDAPGQAHGGEVGAGGGQAARRGDAAPPGPRPRCGAQGCRARSRDRRSRRRRRRRGGRGGVRRGRGEPAHDRDAPRGGVEREHQRRRAAVGGASHRR